MKGMGIRRRDFLTAAATTVTAIGAASWAFAQRGQDMFGLIGKMTAVEGKRDELIAILLAGVAKMPDNAAGPGLAHGLGPFAPPTRLEVT